MQVPAVTQLWAGHRGHRGDLDTGEFLLLQAAGMGEGEYTLKDSTGNTRCDKGKVQGMGGGVGSPQRWPVPPEARRRLPGKSAPEGQSGGKEQAGQRESSLCRARWYEAASSVPIDGANVGAASSSRLFLWISLAPLSWLKGPPWSHPHHPPKFLP